MSLGNCKMKRFPRCSQFFFAEGMNWTVGSGFGTNTACIIMKSSCFFCSQKICFENGVCKPNWIRNAGYFVRYLSNFTVCVCVCELTSMLSYSVRSYQYECWFKAVDFKTNINSVFFLLTFLFYPCATSKATLVVVVWEEQLQLSYPDLLLHFWLNTTFVIPRPRYWSHASKWSQTAVTKSSLSMHPLNV